MNENRVSRFRQALAAAGLDGAVVRKPSNVFYLSGYPAGPEPPSFLVVGPERLALIAPGSAEAARRVVGSSVEVFGYAVPGSTLDRVPDVPRLSAAAIESAVESAGLGGKRVGVEETALSAWHARVIARLATSTDLGDALEALRRIKDEGELSLIRAAVRVNDRGFEAAARAIGPGVSELAVLNAVVAAMQEAAGLPIDVLDPTNAFISGPRTMLAAAPATPRRLETGDVMIVDVNPYIGPYKGDTTRSFCLGPPTPGQRRAHDSLVRGLEAAERIGRPGARGRDVFAALLGPIDAAGFGAGFRFHGGHALGLEHVERPYVIPGEEMVLDEGMVIALEPAVYLPEIGGLRIEDNYVVTSRGLEGLSEYPRELVECRGLWLESQEKRQRNQVRERVSFRGFSPSSLLLAFKPEPPAAPYSQGPRPHPIWRSMPMQAAYLFGTRDLRIVEREPLSLRPEDVRVAVACSGICGTDLHVYSGMVFGRAPTEPVAFGHEFAGRVIEVGEAVTTVAVGDRVTAIPNTPCGKCAFCRSGRGYACQNRGGLRSGSWAPSVVIREQNVFRLPDAVSDRVGSLTEPLACAVRAVDRSGIRSGDRVCVVGGGPIGLFVATVAKASGASLVLVSEPRPYRRELATRMGIDRAIDPTSEDLGAAVRAATDDLGADVVFEAVGHPATIAQAIAVAAPGATVVIVGVTDAAAQATFPAQQIFHRELTIRGTRGPTFAVERAIRWLATLDFEPIITHSFPLARVAEAMDLGLSGNAGKIMLIPS